LCLSGLSDTNRQGTLTLWLVVDPVGKMVAARGSG